MRTRQASRSQLAVRDRTAAVRLLACPVRPPQATERGTAASWQSRALPCGQKARAGLGRAAPSGIAAELSVMSSHSMLIKLA